MISGQEKTINECWARMIKKIIIIDFGKVATYNIFVHMNINNSDSSILSITNLLTVIGQPVRIRILFILHKQDACVCHLEAVLGIRQAAISQHLMALRKAGLVETLRDGRNIYYRITNPGIIPVLQQTAELVDVDLALLAQLGVRPHPDCPCPQCNPLCDADFSCQELHPKRKMESMPVKSGMEN